MKAVDHLHVMQKEKHSFPFPLLEPWEEVTAYGEQISEELKKEVREDGILYRKEAVAIVRRKDCDDVLFDIQGMKEKLAVIHLTWSGKKDPNSGWPFTTLFSDLESWKTECMIPDHEDYTD